MEETRLNRCPNDVFQFESSHEVIRFDGSVDCLKGMGASRGQAPNDFQFSRRSPNIEERLEG